MKDKIIFLYKPAFFGENKMKKHIDFYARERQEELFRAGVLELYEDYWNTKTVLRTNVYGALPLSVLSKAQEECLTRFGWRVAEVEFSAGTEDAGTIDEQLSAEDCGYMLLKEDSRFSILSFAYAPLAWQ